MTHLLGTEDIEDRLAEFILEKAEGVPFFIEEFIKSLYEVIAHHSFLGKDWERAYKYNGEAGLKAHSFSAYEEEQWYFEASIEALKNLLRTKVRTWIHVWLGTVYLLQGRPNSAIKMLEQALALCRDADILSAFSFIAASLGHTHCLLGNPDAALSILHELKGGIWRIGFKGVFDTDNVNFYRRLYANSYFRFRFRRRLFWRTAIPSRRRCCFHSPRRTFECNAHAWFASG